MIHKVNYEREMIKSTKLHCSAKYNQNRAKHVPEANFKLTNTPNNIHTSEQPETFIKTKQSKQ